jgi:lysophospholipase L1-like esterase
MLNRLQAGITKKRVLVAVPALLLTYGIAQGVAIRAEWLTKPLMKAPEQVAGEATSEENEEKKKVSRRAQSSLAVQTLDDIIAQAKKGSLLEALQGKGREILKDFEHLSKREKVVIIDILKGRVQKTTDSVRENLEKIRKTATEIKDRIRRQQARTQRHWDGTSALEKITKIVKMSRGIEENSHLMLEIGSVLDEASTKKRKIKLLFIGDSLSACVGVDRESDGPVLQKTVANHVQSLTGRDVEWYNSAVVGGTVREIRDKLGETPFLKDIRRDEDLIVVLICGLNDYKSFLFSLWNPLLAMKSGPMSFKAEVMSLLEEIRTDCVSENSCVFLPAIPVRFMASDPKFLFSVFPLSVMGLSLNTIWDIQKYNIAFEQQAEAAIYKGHDEIRSRDCKNTFYIAEPESDNESEERCRRQSHGDEQEQASESETRTEAALDVVAKDGVHLNSNGYKLWGKHLAQNISDHLINRMQHKQPFAAVEGEREKRD